MSDVTIRDFKTSEADRLGHFFHTEWRENHILYRNRELLMWLYHNNPYSPARGELLTCKAAFCEDQVVGIFAYFPFVFNRYGDRQHGCNLSAWWVHPNFRKKHVGLTLLYELQNRGGYDACVSGMNTNIAESLYTAMGWVVTKNIHRMIQPLDIDQLSRLAEEDSSETAASVKQRLANLHSRQAEIGTANHENMTVTELASPNELPAAEWDLRYWQKIAPTHMGPAREVKYLQWRFGDIPIFKYRTLAATRGGKIIGLLVFRVEQIRDRSEKVVRIVDFVAELDTAEALAQAVVKKAREEQAMLVDFFCTQKRYNDALMKVGFVDASNHEGQDYWFPYLFQPVDFGKTKLNCAWWLRDMDLKTTEARDDFALMKGDYEFDRPN